jgi:hypothetical protein
MAGTKYGIRILDDYWTILQKIRLENAKGR